MNTTSHEGDDDPEGVYLPTPEKITRMAEELREKAIATRRAMRCCDYSRRGVGAIREWDTTVLRPRRGH